MIAFSSIPGLLQETQGRIKARALSIANHENAIERERAEQAQDLRRVAELREAANAELDRTERMATNPVADETPARYVMSGDGMEGNLVPEGADAF